MFPTVWSTISETLEEAGKQRLLNALKLADHTVGNINNEGTPASFLENERYKKYGRVGKRSAILKWQVQKGGY
ncbi:hypothetical protein D5086_012975 [Populus alba]|uniref:Uncharacterized protein n=1 Tax=Populus alba TaxID=43335 RepID=A0ACC4C475_POPAL